MAQVLPGLPVDDHLAVSLIKIYERNGKAVRLEVPGIILMDPHCQRGKRDAVENGVRAGEKMVNRRVQQQIPVAVVISGHLDGEGIFRLRRRQGDDVG